MRHMLLLMAGLTLVSTSTAFAADRCSVPKTEWQSEQALRQKLGNDGWAINRVKIDRGCYEVYGTNAEGQRAETYFDPKTFEVVGEG